MSGEGGYTRVLPVHRTWRAAAMPPSQNAGRRGIVRSSLVMRKIGASACGLVDDGALVVHDRLRRRRAAGGVDDEGVVGGRHLPLDGGEQLVVGTVAAVGARQQVVDRSCPPEALGVVEPHGSQVRCAREPERAAPGVGQAGKRDLEVLPEVASQEPARPDEDLGVARADDVGQLGRCRQRADRCDERPDAEGGVERGEEQRAVGRQQGDPRALAGPAREQRPRHAGRAPFELGVGERLVGGDQGGVLRPRTDDVGEQRREGRWVGHVGHVRTG